MATDNRENRSTTPTPPLQDNTSDQEPENFESLATENPAIVNQSLTALGFRLPENKIRWFYDGDLMDKPPPLPKNTDTNTHTQNGENESSNPSPQHTNSTQTTTISNENNCKWVAFKGDDSLKLEREWRKYLTIIQNNAANLEKKHKKSPKLENSIHFEKVVVCGGMYEVDLLARECVPIYYKGDIVSIRRGVWFYEATRQPMKENLASSVEQEHVTRWSEDNTDFNLTELAVQSNRDPLDDIRNSAPDIFDDDAHNIQNLQSSQNSQSSVLSPKASTTSLNSVVHRAILRKMQFEWMDSDNIWVSTPTPGWTGLAFKLVRNTRSKVTRGFYEEAQPYDKFAPIKHVVFMVHGVGAFRDDKKIIRNTKHFEGHVKKMLSKIQFESKNQPDSKNSYGNRSNKITGRVVFMPIEWRSRLVLDQGILSSTTVDSIRKYRDIGNDTVMDLFYYNSPYFKDEILDSAEKSFKTVVDKFKLRNPEYDGDFSIFAHSLGSVICYDLLMGWHQEKWAEQAFKNCKDEVFKNEILKKIGNTKQDSRIGLDKIKFFFSVASPLGVMRTMDGVNPPKKPEEQPELILPEYLVERHINIFHPNDPFAFRLEPLIHNFYKNVVPMKVHKSTDKVVNDYGEVGICLKSEVKTRNEKRQVRRTERREKRIELKHQKSELKLENKTSKASIKREKELMKQSIVEEDSDETPENSINDEQFTPEPVSKTQTIKNVANYAFGRWRNRTPVSPPTKSVLEKERSTSLSPTPKTENSLPSSGTLNTENLDFLSKSTSSISQPTIKENEQRKRSGEEIVNDVPPDQSVDRIETSESVDESRRGSMMVPDLPTGRVDFEVPDHAWTRFTELKNILTSHSSYWHNPDVALFMLELFFPGCSLKN